MTTPHLSRPMRQRSAMTGAAGLRNGMYLPSVEYLNRFPSGARERSLPASSPWIPHRPDNVSKRERASVAPSWTCARPDSVMRVPLSASLAQQALDFR